MRELALDTETTGLEARDHRIIEVACVEIVNRQITGREFHEYVNPERSIAREATRVHGIRTSDLLDKPRFEEIADALLAFLKDARVLIHNASFDQAFIDMELRRCERPERLESVTSEIVDTAAMAARDSATKRAGLDHLCKRYGIDISGRNLHGALKDASLLASVYLKMTGGQLDIFGSGEGPSVSLDVGPASVIRKDRTPVVIRATPEELALHEAYMQAMESEMRSDAADS